MTPPKRELDRIFREKREMGKIFTNFRLKENINVNFSLPSEGIVSSEFGLRRFLNGQARSPHSGIDIAAARGQRLRTLRRNCVNDRELLLQREDCAPRSRSGFDHNVLPP